MTLDLPQLHKEARARLEQVSTPADLEEWWRATLGRKGEIQLLTRRVGELAPSERPAFGRRVNELKQALKVVFVE